MWLLKRTFVSVRNMVQGEIQALVLCGPSGCGKSTLLKKLFKDYPEKFQFSVSHTTRSPRPGEVDGVHYYFTTKDQMEEAIKNGDFVENAVYSNNMYGTSKKTIEDCSKNGKLCVLDIDIQGVKQIKQTDINALFVFIKPPSLETLAERLKKRGTETEETLTRRLNAAQEEITYGETPDNFDLIVVNDSLECAYSQIKNFVMKALGNQNETSGDSNN